MKKSSIRVKLLDSTAYPLKAIYYGARTCYSGDSPIHLWKKKPDRAAMESLILKTIQAGHHSVLEHAVFVFGLGGISRACSHQLVRHRLASFSQQSQRYVKSQKPDYIIPPSISQNPAILKEFKQTITSLYETYQKFCEKGIPPEDARFVLPNASATNLIITMNLRELLHVCAIRLCANAQWEIRQLFQGIKQEIIKKDSFLGGLINPKCDTLGYCSEIRSCKRYPQKNEVFLTKEKLQS
jgi:thymidylate synthase (FAD)